MNEQQAFVCEMIRSERYPMNQYVQFVRCAEPDITYIKHNQDRRRQARFCNLFQGHRRAYPFIGELPVEAITLAMSRRQYDAGRIISDPQRWDGRCKSSSELVGDKLSAGTLRKRLFLEAMTRVIEDIRETTKKQVSASDLLAVMSPCTALALGESEEIKKYRAEQPKQEWYENALWCLPERIKGIRLIIDDSTHCFHAQGRKNFRNYCLPDGIIAVLARPGERDGVEDVVSYATVQNLWHGEHEMTVMEKEDKRWVTDTSMVELTCPLSGFLITEVC